MKPVAWTQVEANVLLALKYVGCERVSVRRNSHHLQAVSFIRWLRENEYELPCADTPLPVTSAEWIDQLLKHIFGETIFYAAREDLTRPWLDVRRMYGSTWYSPNQGSFEVMEGPEEVVVKKLAACLHGIRPRNHRQEDIRYQTADGRLGTYEELLESERSTVLRVDLSAGIWIYREKEGHRPKILPLGDKSDSGPIKRVFDRRYETERAAVLAASALS